MSDDFNLEFEISPEEIIFDDKGIIYKGRRVILYIRNQVQNFSKGGEYKFHIAGCSTLRNILARGLYEKYVVAENTSGVFKVNYIYDGDFAATETELHVCKHCLRTLNWQGFKKASAAQKNKIYKNFSIAEFFDAINNNNQKKN